MERDTLIEAIFANMQQMHRVGSSKFHALMGQQDISPSQMELLVAVKHMQPVSVKDIAARMRLTPGAVTQLIEGLVTKGYVERQADTQDRRVTHISLADEGATKLRELWEHRKAGLRRIMETLDSEELNALIHVQEKIIQRMQDFADEPTKSKQ